MTGTRAPAGGPKAILLATDLSPRCDRALDRAVILAKQWNAELVIVHVLETSASEGADLTVPSWRRPPDPASVARRQLQMDVGEVAARARIVVEAGDPAEVTARVADERGCDLIVTGIARDELLGRFLLGTTVDRLLRRSRVPLLVVRSRASHPYRHVAVATDFSEPSRHALEVALRDFPGDAFSLFHAYDMRVSPLMDDAKAYRGQMQEAARQKAAAFLASMDLDAATRTQVRTFVEFGEPATVLRQGVKDLGVDLIVLGTHGRGALLEVLVGSVAKDILDQVPCDALLVRTPDRAEAQGG
ncbi:universal stress protein [Xanthobacter pseudotagetidis]|uniref:universal stress protein n=1 Tax=Xanthobacter pseudotagetidis TaxID=3119911 RepID=UPI00372BDCB7